MQNVQHLEQLRTREQTAIEQALPPHIMYIAFARANRSGFEVRADFMHHLNQSMELVMRGLDDFTAQRVAKIVDERATELLRDTNANNGREVVLGIAYMVLMLVEEGLHPDPRSQSALQAMVLLQEAKDTGTGSDAVVWEVDEKRFRELGDRFLMRCRLMGMYLNKPQALRMQA